MLEVYLNGNAYVARDVFNAIATFVGTSSYQSAIYIASIFSVLGGAYLYVKSRDIMSISRWAACYFVVTIFMIGPTTSISIVDTTDPLATYQVDNVPSSLAVIANTVSTLAYGLQQGIETVFQMPDDQEYTKSGMLFGSQVFARSAGYTIQNPQTRTDFNAFFDRCIKGDVVINHKYTFNDLYNQSDIWQFLDDQNMSEIRGVMHDGKFTTCAAFYPIVKKEMQEDPSNSNLTLFGLHLFGSSDAHLTKQELSQDISNAYSYFSGVSKAAGQILSQNATINALRDAELNTLSIGNAQAGMENLAYTQVNLQKELAGFTGAKAAAYWMPLLQVYLFLTIVGCFPLIVLLALQPALTIQIVRSYISSILLICCFPLVWDILHFLMMSALYQATHDNLGNAIAMTYSNVNSLVAAHMSFAAVGGYLMLGSIPLTAALVTGLNRGMIYMSQTLGGALSQMVNQASSSVGTGNVSLENFSMGQTSYNNTSANKLDTNSVMHSGLNSVQGMNGSILTYAADGKLVVNNTAGISQPGFKVNLHDREEAALSSEMSHLQQEQSSLNTQRSENWSAMASTLSNFAQTEGKGVQMGEGFQVTSSTSARDSMSYAAGLYNNWQLSHDHSDRNEHSASRGMSADAFAKLNLGFWGDRIRAGGGVSANVSASRTNSHSDQQAFYNSLSVDQRHNFDQAMDNLQSYGHNHNLDLSNTKNQSLMDQFAAEARHDQSLSQQEALNQIKMDSVSSRQSFVHSNSQSIDMDATQGFVSWLQQKDPQRAGLLLSQSADHVENLRDLKASYMESFLREKTADMMERIDVNAQANTLSKHYENDASQLASGTKSSLDQQASSTMSGIRQDGHSMGVGVSAKRAGNLAGQVIDKQFKDDMALDKAKDDSNVQRNDVHQQAGQFEKQHQAEMHKGQIRNVGEQVYKDLAALTPEPELGGKSLDMPNKEGDKK